MDDERTRGADRRMRGLLILLLALCFERVLLGGEVVAPHPNDRELGLVAPIPDHLSNRKFSDYSSGFIPGLAHQLNSRGKARFPLWVPNNGLGRPSTLLAVPSRAFPPIELLALVTHDAHVAYTILVLLTFTLAAFAGYGFMREIRLTPLAAFVGSALVVFSFQMTYWPTFVLFLTPVAFSLAILWGIASFIRTRRLRPWLLTGLSVYGLFSVGYPQYVILYAYLCGGFALWAWYRAGGLTRRDWRTFLALAGSAILGIVLLSPVLIDVWADAQRSNRTTLSDDFYLRGVGDIRSPGAYARYALETFDPWWSGNPAREGAPLLYDDFKLSPLLAALLLLSLSRPFLHRSWRIHLVLLALLLLTHDNTLRLLAVHHFGFGVSRFVATTGWLVPSAVAAALVIDELQRGRLRPGAWHAAILVSIAGLVVLTRVWSRSSSGADPDWTSAGWGLVSVVGVAGFVFTRRPWLMLAAIGCWALCLQRPLILTQPARLIQTTSPLVQVLRDSTAGGLRYAALWTSAHGLLPPNQDTLLGLNSVHVYDSLLPRSFAEYVERWSPGSVAAWGRAFPSISAERDLQSPALACLGVNTIVSDRPLATLQSLPAQVVTGTHVYRMNTPPVLVRRQGWVASDPGPATVGCDTGGRPGPDTGTVQVREHLDDFWRLEVSPERTTTLVWLSSAFHPRWRARYGSQPLRTVAVDEVFQGVIIPPGARSVTVQFEPWARLAWISQIVSAVLLGLAAFRPSASLEVFGRRRAG